MQYSYNKLWKLLIDKHMTRTEMRKLSGISTTILAKMGRDEPISMKSLSRIATALGVGFSDIVEAVDDGEEIYKPQEN